MRRSNFARRVWTPAVQRAGLDGLRFHALATPRWPWPSARERIPGPAGTHGHGSVTVTLDRQGHPYEGLDGQIADGLDGALQSSRGLVAA